MSTANLFKLIIGGWILGVLLALLACGDATQLSTPPAPPPPPPENKVPDPVSEARALFPRTIDLHSKVIARTCSPNPGVCHQANNYPDLRTTGSLLALVRAPCNLEMPDPKQGWDSCEQRADKLRAGSMLSDLAWIEKKSAGAWRVGFRDPAPTDGRNSVEIYTADGRESVFTPPVEWDVGVNLVAGEKEADLTAGYPDAYLTEFVDSILATVVGGDPNGNGIFGAEDPNVARGALIEPGKLDASYLWGRITGTVPGSRMPLANQPLSEAEYVAVACFIEGLAHVEEAGALDAIDYDACTFAQNPIPYALY